MSHYYTVKRVCEVCHIEFMGERWRVNKGLERFCSPNCTNVWKKESPIFHKPRSEEVKKKISLSHIGIRQTEESKQKIRIARARQIVPKFWNGSKREYMNLHQNITRWWGKPTTCENCGKTGLSGHFIHWANVSNEYKKERSDWKRLCAKCHKQHDQKIWEERCAA
jgi:hypothetical protein